MCALISGVASANAAIITLPTGLNPGDHYRLVFVTANAYNSVSTDIAWYNNAVNTEANANADLSPLNTTWLAIASTSDVSAIDNIPSMTGIPPYNLNGDLVAADATTGTNGLWSGNLLAPINFDENGGTHNYLVWTGTATDGTGAASHQLGDPPNFPIYGLSSATGYDWTNHGGNNNITTLPLPLYAISGDLTVPGVPEPGTILLSVTGLALLLIGAKRKQIAAISNRSNS